MPNVRTILKEHPVLSAVVVGFIFAKLCFTAFTIIAADEAYYWVWGQQFQLSYFDHPPLNAWIIGLTSLLFGNNVLGMRLPTLITFGGTAYVYWLFARQLVPQKATASFLTIIAAFLASPTLFAWTSIVYNDHLLIFFTLASVYCFAKHFGALIDDETPDLRWLYGGAVLLGLAALSKYNTAFLGVSVALVVLGHPKLWRLLHRQHIYLAGIFSVCFFLPVLIWNLQNEFASFQLHLNDRYTDPIFSVFLPAPFYRFILSTIVYFGPILLLPMVMLFLPVKQASGFGKAALWIARVSIALSTLYFTLSASRGAVHWYWMAPSYALMLAFLPPLLRNIWLLGLHFVLGAIFAVYATFNYTVAPVEILMGLRTPEVERVYGWSEFAEELLALQIEHNGIPLGTTHYTTAGQLAHTLGTNDVYDFSPQPTHFSYIDRKALSPGEDALVLHDKLGDFDTTAQRFEKFTHLTRVEHQRFGHVINAVDIYLAEGFIK